MAGAFVLLGAEEVKAHLADVRQRMEQSHRLLAAIGEVVVASVRRNFEAGGRPTKWTPLAQSTLRRKKNPDHQVLIDRGLLHASITAKVEGDQVRVGTNKKYAAIHQFGGACGAGHRVMMPARPYLMVQDEDWTEIRDIGRRFYFGADA